MDKNDILNILNDWNLWKQDLETGIPRSDYLNKLQGYLSTDQIIVIAGPRRSGKSYIMRQFAKELIAKGVDKNEILMVNFEDPRFEKLDTAHLQQIYDVYQEFLHPTIKPYLFLDEIQEVEGWEKWVRTMHELGKARLIISGSNATLLSKELATLLTGRHIDLTVFPLSFSEQLLFRGLEVKDELDMVDKRIELAHVLNDSFEFGSFPEVVLSGEKKQILLGYYDDIVTKDLVRRFKIRKSEQLKSLANFYFSNVSSLITFNSIEKFLNISADTIEKFSGYFEDAYLLYFIKRFSFKMREQEKSPRKVYAVDTGLANMIGFRHSPNAGRIAECYVLQQLARKRAIDPNIDVYYWKDPQHREVDFVVKEGNKVNQLIQVCWNPTDHKTKERETRSLLKAMDEFKLKEGTVITESYEGDEEMKEMKISFIPLMKWLLF